MYIYICMYIYIYDTKISDKESIFFLTKRFMLLKQQCSGEESTRIKFTKWCF